MTVTETLSRRTPLPDPVRETLDQFREEFRVEVHLWARDDGNRRARLYPSSDDADQNAIPGPSGEGVGWVVRKLSPREGPELELAVRAPDDGRSGREVERVTTILHAVLERTYDFAQEIRFFTYELSERYEEINLLYSISETLGSILRLDDAARVILGEVTDVLGARRGSLWVYDAGEEVLRLTASVGEEGIAGPLEVGHPDAITARVFREGRSLITHHDGLGPAVDETLHGTEVGEDTDSFLSVPIRYTPPAGEPRTVGVINLIGRRHGGRFTASDQKLLSAIASQIGAALENNRLIQESLAQERVAREMELAHNLQMKLLPGVDKFEGARVAARVVPAESVGGDFYHFFNLSEGRIGVMIGDVSSHGFPAALIMALSMSAATIYASEFGSPAKVLRHMDDALRDELESTEMYLTLCYAVVDFTEGRLVYSNAGHPHAFIVKQDESLVRLDATDPPVGFAGPEAYGQREEAWDPDDILVLFTDGLSDTLTSEATGSGEELLLRKIVENMDRSPEEIVEVLFGLTIAARPTIPSDDRTAVVLKA